MSVETSSRTLLLVEDNPADAELVREMLDAAADKTAYSVRHVPRLADAAAVLSAEPVDVVLLDLRLPDGAGVEGVSTLLNVSRDVPIVVLTGIEDEALALSCIDAGAQDYLNKDELKPLSLRRAIGYSITRRREAQLSELQQILAHYRSLSSEGASTSVTAAMVGLTPVRRRHPQLFESLAQEYVLLLDSYLEQLGYKADKPRDLMERLITRIGDTGAGPRDLLDVHVAALDYSTQGVGVERARALVVEGRLLALEMMGLLVDYYRVGNRRRFAAGDAR